MAEDRLDPAMFEQIGNGTPFEVVVRGHLWVESQLVAVLDEVLPFPEQIDLSRLTFPQKVSLVAAHGFIRPDDTASYLKLNKLRNRLAHRAGEDPDEQWADELYQAFGAHLRFLAGSLTSDPEFGWGEWESRLQLEVVTLCVALDVERERFVAHRREVAVANKRLRLAAGRLLDAATKKA